VLMFIRVLAKSKLLFVPFVITATATAGTVFVTYKITRGIVSAPLSVDFTHAGSSCRALSSSAAGVGVMGALYYRLSNYIEPDWNAIKQTIETEEHANGKTAMSNFRVQRKFLWQQVKGPAYFYASSAILCAAVAGGLTPIALRFLCGKTIRPIAKSKSKEHEHDKKEHI